MKNVHLNANSIRMQSVTQLIKMALNAMSMSLVFITRF